MKSRFLRKIAKSQKYQILHEIKRSQGLSVSELCEKIELSYMGVKQHCVSLEKDGYLDTWRRPKGMGRPEKAYRLTPQAQDFFPTEATRFTEQVLVCIEQVYGPASPEKILYQIFQNEIKRYRSLVQVESFEEKIQLLARIRDEEGFMSEYLFDPDKAGHQILEYNSPILSVAERYDIVHRLERELFEQVLDASVERREERISGLYKCVYQIQPR
jgi:predicted ArsR family transcriptional regulator